MATTQEIEKFRARWLGSAASEKSNSQLFLTELTDLLGVPHPQAAVNDPAKDQYVFERRVAIAQPGGERVGWIDLYKAGCFVLESKQGANAGKRHGFAKRDTPMWENEMEKARGQAKGYAQTLAEPPPFILVCDVGHVFELHASFDASAHWTAFPDPPKNRLYLADFGAEQVELLRAVWTDPHSLDPSQHQAQVSRDVAVPLAKIARSLEARGHNAELVAEFLMRCIFTMFAEDVGLFAGRRKLFEEYLEKYWIPNHGGFPGGVQAFWSTMNTGGVLLTGEQVRRFNGGLFANPLGLPLNEEELTLLLQAAKLDWSQVEPAVFGTLIERALDPKERHKLGAHFTPRAYVERLVRPTIDEPLRADWLVVQAEARRLREDGNVKAAAKALQAFHRHLCEIRVLDPACGSGNFLYVALDLVKRLEAEVREELWRLGDEYKTELMEFDTITVQPKQFLGIEKKRWAKEIAELVLWIGYLRWHFRAKGDRGEVVVPEPVLESYSMIEWRDAVLDWDGPATGCLVTDEAGRPATRWDGETMRTDPVTGAEVPDENATALVYEYPNPRVASWPAADFIVGNPPFLGKLYMLSVLGDGYVEALRSAYGDDVPDGVDFVMYWWFRAAMLVASGSSRRFGLITTKSIAQSMNGRVVAKAMEGAEPISLVYAIPNHPWVDSTEGAAVRIAMSVGVQGAGKSGVLATVVRETRTEDDSIDVDLTERRGVIHHDFRIGADVASAQPLRSNEGLAATGFLLGSRGFVISEEEATNLLSTRQDYDSIVFQLRNGRDLTKRPRGEYVIDATLLEEDELRRRFPEAYQHLRDHVFPKRQQNRDPRLRREWWKFRRSAEKLRAALTGLKTYLATSETSRHRVFFRLGDDVRPEHKLVVIAVESPWVLGVVSSRIHGVWALAAGGNLGKGDDPVYAKTKCFDAFPFPVATDVQKATIARLAQELEDHRATQLAAHPKLTITAMYNVLVKARSGVALTVKEQVDYEDGLVAVLRKIHDDLDDAVFDAYGWSPSMTDDQILEELVDLNAKRVDEEAKGKVRWLRPTFQAPISTGAAQTQVPGTAPTPSKKGASKVKRMKWPRKFADRAAAVRDVVLGARAMGAFSAKDVADRFSRAKVDDVVAVLEAFAALGLLVAFEVDGTAHWARPAPLAQ